MEVSVIARQVLLFGHIIAFALALATIIKEDARLLWAKRIDSASLLSTAKLVKWLLLALWLTGAPMVLLDIGADVSLLLAKPKLATKLIVVGMLTLNGLLLHFVAFPMVTNPKNPKKTALVAATLGAVSTASWIYASFVGTSRIVAPHLSLQDFLVLYVLTLALAVSFALLIVRNWLELLLKPSGELNQFADDQGYNLSAAILEAEIARLALIDIQVRLETKRSAQPVSAYRRAAPARAFGE